MLQRKKINKAANAYSKPKLHKNLLAASFCITDFAAGATWASEQYAGVVEALERMLEAFNEHYALTGVTNRARLSAISELNKLKQP